MKVRIKIGTIIYHDLGCFEWPMCKPPKSEFENDDEYVYRTKFPNAVFDYDGVSKCIRSGYGQRGNYGNGVIHVSSVDDLVIVTA